MIKNERVDVIAVYLLGLLTILPLTRIGLLFRVAVVALVIMISLRHFAYKMKLPAPLIFLFMAIISGFTISAIYGFLFFQPANVNLITHEAVRMLLNLLIIYSMFFLSTKTEDLFRICLMVFLFTFFVQLLQVFFTERTNAFLKRYYIDPGPIPVGIRLAELGWNSGARYGSIYINANICAQVSSICLCFFLWKFYKEKRKKHLLLIAATFVSVFLCGSRSGFLLCAIVLVCFLWLSRSYKILIALGGICLGGLCVLIQKYGAILLKMFRSLDIIKGLSNSFGAKIGIFIDYLSNSSVFSLLFGSIGDSNFVQVDAEWWYILSLYGVIGFIWYCFLIYYIYRYGLNNKIIKKLLIIIFVASGFTETTYMCLPVSTFFLTLVLNKEKQLGSSEV